MNTHLWRTELILLGLATPLAAALPSDKPDTATTTALKEQFRFEAPAPAAPPEPAPAPEVVRMERIVVRESKLLKPTFQMLDERRRVRQRATFSWTEGGRRWEGRFAGYPVEIGAWALPEVFLADSRFHEGSTLARIELARAPW